MLIEASQAAASFRSYTLDEMERLTRAEALYAQRDLSGSQVQVLREGFGFDFDRVMEVSDDLTDVIAGQGEFVLSPRLVDVLRACTPEFISRDKLKKLQKEHPRDSGPRILRRLFDLSLFPWLAEGRKPTPSERREARAVISDRLARAQGETDGRQMHARRHGALLTGILQAHGLRARPGSVPVLTSDTWPDYIANGEYVGEARVSHDGEVTKSDVTWRLNDVPTLMEAKFAADSTNGVKRSYEMVNKVRHWQRAFGGQAQAVVLVGGEFRAQSLMAVQAAGAIMVFEHAADEQVAHLLGQCPRPTVPAAKPTAKLTLF